MSDILEALPMVEVSGPDYAKSAQLLEQALRVGSKEPEVSYLLAMCYKRLGRTAEARALLQKIPDPDANVYLQRGLLAYAEKEFSQAEQDFGRAWELEPQSFPAGYNLVLARLSQGHRDACIGLVDRLLASAPDHEQKFLGLLRTLLAADGVLSYEQQQTLAAMSLEDEAQLVKLVSGLGQVEVVLRLLQQLVHLRPHSHSAHEAYFAAALRQARNFLDRCQWEEIKALLVPLAGKPDVERVPHYQMLALLNLLGVASAMLQDFEPARHYFQQALEWFQRAQNRGAQNPLPHQVNHQGIYMGAWLEQNLALVLEWMGRLDRAEHHWLRYFDYLEYYFPHSHPKDYLPNLAFEGLNRLAELFTRREKWTNALGFLSKAHKIRPNDTDVLERMFHLYNQLKKPEEAKRILKRLREVRPNDPQVEFFELEVRDLRDVEDLDRLINDMRRSLQKYPGNMLVEDRTSALIANLVPFEQKLIDQWGHQVAKVIDQMRRLPSYQINWPVVRDIMRDLGEKFYRLRQIVHRSITLARSEDLQSELTRLLQTCDRKIEQCQSLGDG